MDIPLEMEMVELANVIHMLTVRYVTGEIAPTDHRNTLTVLLDTYKELCLEEPQDQVHCS